MFRRWALIPSLTHHRVFLIRTAIGAVTFGLGLYGFIEAYRPTDVRGYLDCLFRTIQLLFAQFPGEMPRTSGGQPGDVHWTLQIARFGMPLFFAWVMLTTLLREIRKPLRTAGIGAMRGHVIVFGDDPLVPKLMGQQVKRRRGAVIIGASHLSDVAAASERLGAALLVGSASEIATWRRAGLRRATTVLLLSTDDASNLAAAFTVADAAREVRDPEGVPVQVVVAVENREMKAILDQGFRGREPPPGVTLRIVSRAEIVVRSLLAQHPLHAGVDVRGGEAVHALVIGFGAVGEQLALQILKNGIVSEQALPRVTVLDRSASKLRPLFLARNGDAPILNSIRFRDVDLEAKAQTLPEELAKKLDLGSVNAAFVCVGNDTDGLLLTLALRRHWATAGLLAPPVYICQRGANDLGGRLASAELQGIDTTRVHTFGDFEAGDPESIAGEKLDQLARVAHEIYLANFPPKPGDLLRDGQRPWSGLKENYRQSNRDQTDYLPMRLACLGVRQVNGRGEAPTLDPGVVEAAARSEHIRWCVSYELMGWRYGAGRDDSRMLHPSLTEYDSLTVAEKDKDRAVLREVSALLAAIGNRLVVDNPMWLGLDARAPVEANVDRILNVELHSGSDAGQARQPLLLSSLSSALECEVLHAIATRKSPPPWRLALDKPVEQVLADLPNAGVRYKARWLIHNAEQVICSTPRQREVRPLS